MCPSIFWHPTRQIRTLVHGDDFFSARKKESLDWLQVTLESQYELKTQRVALRKGCAHEGKVLNRVVRQTRQGWELEADPRHAELIIEQMDVKKDKGVATPITDDLEHGDEEDDAEKLNEVDARNFRGVAARANCLSADRPDLQYAVKEAARSMAKPCRVDWGLVTKIGRYLIGKPRVTIRFPWQRRQTQIDGYSDSDWAACPTSRPVVSPREEGPSS